MVANSPSCGALVACGRDLVRLTIDAKIHDVVPANSTVVYDNIPSPECNSIPLFDFKFGSVLLALLSSRG